MAASDPILKIKLFVQPVNENTIQRTDLLQRLEQGNDKKLTLISAPAGFGKTTLVAQWLARHPDNAAWLSIDENDNDLLHFIRYLIASLRTVNPDLGAGSLAAIQSALPNFPPVSQLLSPLLNDLLESSNKIFLVLDDYQNIQLPAIHEAIQFLLDHLVATLHIVLITRSDPPFPLARLRSQGELNEIRAADLRFRPEDSNRFFKEIHQLNLNSEQLHKIFSRAEGWPAGLQLAALAIQDQEDINQFIEIFAGTHDYIADYLFEEVLNQQTDKTRQFLLYTSILPRFSAELCEAVTEQGDSAAQLNWLQTNNIFLVPLDLEKQWYRYHHLFSDLLQKRLQLSRPELSPSLHKRAAAWFLSKKMQSEAVIHLIQGKQFRQAAEVLETLVEIMLMQSQVSTLYKWIESIPEEITNSHPKLSIYYAATALITAKPKEEIEHLLFQAENSDTRQEFRGEYKTISTLLLILQGELPQAIQSANQALEFLAEDQYFLRGMVLNSLGMVNSLLGNIDAAKSAYELAFELGLRTNNYLTAASALCNVAGYQLLEGQIDLAESTFFQALELATDPTGKHLPVASRAFLGLGEIKREQNQLEAAEEFLMKGLEFFKHFGQYGAIISYISLANVKSNQNNYPAAIYLLEKARQLSIKFDSTQIDDLLVDITQIIISARDGDIKTGREILEKLSLYPPERFSADSLSAMPFSPSPQIKELQIQAITRILISEERFTEAKSLLINQLQAPTGKNKRFHARLLLIMAIVQYNQGDEEAALQSVQEAIQMIYPNRLIRTFLDEGPVISQLLYKLASRGIYQEYIGKILAHLPIAYGKNQKLIEPLSQRELEVLNLIHQGLSNQEIADQLFISLNTTKGHTRNIYQKLNVKNRSQAIAKSRQLGLLD